MLFLWLQLCHYFGNCNFYDCFIFVLFSFSLHFIVCAVHDWVEFSCWQITYTVTTPEIAFTGDTMSDFIVDEANIDVLRAKILVMEVKHIPYYFSVSWDGSLVIFYST